MMAKRTYRCFLILLLCILPWMVGFSFVKTEPEPTPAAVVETPAPVYGMTNAPGVNVRGGPSTRTEVVFKLANSGTPFAVLETVVVDGAQDWYLIEHGGENGYIRSDLVDLIEEAAYAAKMAPTAAKAAQATKAPVQATKVPVQATKAPAQAQSAPAQEPARESAPQEAPKTAMVWIPNHGGTKYHSHSGCSNMNGPSHVTVEEAVRRGFTPCKKCY